MSRLPGPVFISHSSEDKAFVRRLNDELVKRGFATWLDEKAMVVGDSLPAKISSGLQDAAAVIVVISPAAERSSWLHYELQLATERMTRGLRVLPVLIEDSPVPPELRALVYADFRQDHSSGLEAVLRSLEQLEAATEKQRRTPHFYEVVRARLEDVFEATGFVSTLGEYRSVDFGTCYMTASDGAEIEIVYDEVADYGIQNQPLTALGWAEFLRATEETGAGVVMLISERPLQIGEPTLHEHEDRVRLRSGSPHEAAAFAVDFSGDTSDDEQRRLLALVRDHVLTTYEERN